MPRKQGEPHWAGTDGDWCAIVWFLFQCLWTLSVCNQRAVRQRNQEIGVGFSVHGLQNCILGHAHYFVIHRCPRVYLGSFPPHFQEDTFKMKKCRFEAVFHYFRFNFSSVFRLAHLPKQIIIWCWRRLKLPWDACVVSVTASRDDLSHKLFLSTFKTRASGLSVSARKQNHRGRHKTFWRFPHRGCPPTSHSPVRHWNLMK